jgi:RNA polymerase sigma-70 factor (ECF subfamily)
MTASRHELEALYARLEKPVFNVVYRWLWSREEARDVTQEAFLKVWRGGELSEPLVFRAAMNLAANRLRARRVWKWVGLSSHEDERPSPDESLDAHRRQARVRQAIEALPEKLKAVVVMCELSGLSYAQVAEALKIPIGTVGSRRSLALAALEKQLEDL